MEEEFKEFTVGEYKAVRYIDEGSYGRVYEVTSYNNVYAMKIIDITNFTEEQIDNLAGEIDMLIQFKNPGIIRIINRVQIGNKICIVTKLANKGNLHTMLMQGIPLKAEVILDYLKQIGNAIEYIHSMDCCHSDLKPQNIFINSKNKIKIGDFGVSQFLPPSQYIKITHSTPQYAAPEILKGQFVKLEPDIWAFGVIMYQLITLISPFLANSFQDMVVKVGDCDYNKTLLRSKCSQKAADCVNQILNPDRKARPNIKQVLQLLSTLSVEDLEPPKGEEETMPLPVSSPQSPLVGSSPSAGRADPIIIDLGSEVIRCIKSGADIPKEIKAVYDEESKCFGKEGSLISKTHTYEDTDLNIFEELFNYIFHEISIPDSRNIKNPIIIIERIKGGQLNERILHILFEIHNVPAVIFLHSVDLIGRYVNLEDKNDPAIIIDSGNYMTDISAYSHGLEDINGKPPIQLDFGAKNINIPLQNSLLPNLAQFIMSKGETDLQLKYLNNIIVTGSNYGVFQGLKEGLDKLLPQCTVRVIQRASRSPWYCGAQVTAREDFYAYSQNTWTNFEDYMQIKYS